MHSAQTELAIHLHSGIPVLDIKGEWNESTDKQLADTVLFLSRAGHFEIVVNLLHATRLPSLEKGWLDGLERLAAFVRSHGGRLDVVGPVEQVESGLRNSARSLVRWAKSEVEAICRLKGLAHAVSGPTLTTHLGNDTSGLAHAV